MIFKEYKDYETLDFSKEIQSFWDKNLIFKKKVFPKEKVIRNLFFMRVLHQQTECLEFTI